jgi:hypothetical protein
MEPPGPVSVCLMFDAASDLVPAALEVGRDLGMTGVQK